MITLDDMLRPLVQKATVLKVQKASVPLPVNVSKFGGIPYHEHGEKWPACPTCKKPLSFICQIDLRQTVYPPPADFNFFTFFYCWECMPWESNDETKGQWVVRKYIDPQPGKAVKIPQPKDAELTSECQVSFTERLTLPVWDGTRRWCPGAAEMACQVNSDAPWEAYNEASKAIVGEQNCESRIGGYPNWIQNEETPEGAHLLAQIDSEDDADIMWGDVGCVYLFRAERDSEISFTFQCC